MRLQPIRVDVGRPYYRVSTAIDVVSLFEPDPEIDRDTGSNFLREWS